MTRAAWTDIALDLARLREQLADHAKKSRPVAHRERIIGVMLAARAICRTLRRSSRRFNARQFMRIVEAPSGERNQRLR